MKKNVLKILNSVREKTGDNNYYKILVAIYLFDYLDGLRRDRFPANWFKRLETELEKLSDLFKFFSNSYDFSLNDFKNWKEEPIEDFETKTGEVYFRLWKDFKKDEYYKQALSYLKERFKKNGIEVKNKKTVLDDGCGGGRYTLALKALGCKKVVGVDISENSISLAKRMSPFPENKVSFKQGSVLELPFADQSFDFVFSNGVLHHTSSTEKGLAEIHRVLKNNGSCWLYLYGGKGSLFWDIVDFIRDMLKDVPQNYAGSVMKTLGYPSGRIFHRLDFWYVPTNRRYLESEVVAMAKHAGFSEIKRLKRGVDFDWDEIIYNNPDIDPYIYGEGEMRFLIDK